MPLLAWAARNVARSRVRTVGVALLVGLTLGVFLILAQVGLSIQGSANDAESSVANIVTVQNASITRGPPSGGGGGRGGGGFSTSGGVIAPDEVPVVASTPHVEAVQRIAEDSIFPANTTGFTAPTMTVEAIDTNESIVVVQGLAGGSTLTITSGRDLGPSDETTTNALVGSDYASDNDVGVGSSIDVNGSTFQVVGIFSTTSTFQMGGMVILPYPAADAALAFQGPSLLYVTVDTASEVDAVVTDLESELPSDYSELSLATADQTALQDAINSILQSTQLDESAALVAGAAVMVVVMVLVTSHRVREIGLMKALGYSNGSILGQLTTESVASAALGLPVAFALTAVVGPWLADELLGSSTSTSFSGGGPPGGPGGSSTTSSSSGSSSLTNQLLNSVHFSLSLDIVALGVAVVLLFGLVGAIYPILRAIRLRPTEALRHE